MKLNGMILALLLAAPGSAGAASPPPSAIAALLARPDVAPLLSDDELLADTVASKLFLDHFLSPESVQVSAKDGVIRLEGSVADLREADLAKRMAEGVRGVRRVDGKLKLRITGRPDAEVQQAVQRALSSDPATGSQEIKAAVHRGVLELSGTVELHSDLDLAEWVTEGVPGVLQIRNRLRVREMDTGPTDRELGLTLRSRFRMDDWLSEDPIQTSVAKARARLTGHVSSAAARARAIAVAWLPGIVAVEATGLVVDPSTRDHPAMGQLQKELAASDDNLRADVLQTFRYDARLNGRSPQVTVQDRVATLRGGAEDLAEKLAAEDDAWNVAGVTDIVDELEIPVTIADADLALAVSDALRAELPAETWNRLAAMVKKGAVILAGNVSSSYERWLARDIVSRTKGVVGIDNRVRVIPAIEGTRQAGLTDEELRNRALLVLKWDPLLGAGDDIQLAVTGGVARLTGKVRSPVRAVQAARDAFDAGVRSVKSDLSIRDQTANVITIQRGKGGAGAVTTGGSIEATTYTTPPADSFPSFREPRS